jgi:hypothetical protein
MILPLVDDSVSMIICITLPFRNIWLLSLLEICHYLVIKKWIFRAPRRHTPWHRLDLQSPSIVVGWCKHCCWGRSGTCRCCGLACCNHKQDPGSVIVEDNCCLCNYSALKQVLPPNPPSTVLRFNVGFAILLSCCWQCGRAGNKNPKIKFLPIIRVPISPSYYILYLLYLSVSTVQSFWANKPQSERYIGIASGLCHSAQIVLLVAYFIASCLPPGFYADTLGVSPGFYPDALGEPPVLSRVTWTRRKFFRCFTWIPRRYFRCVNWTLRKYFRTLWRYFVYVASTPRRYFRCVTGTLWRYVV